MNKTEKAHFELLKELLNEEKEGVRHYREEFKKEAAETRALYEEVQQLRDKLRFREGQLEVCQSLLNPKLDRDTEYIVVQGKVYAITGYILDKSEMRSKTAEIEVYATSYEFDKEALSK